MDRAAIQRRIDAVTWYHDFDFGDGLAARTRSHAEEHRRFWRRTEAELNRIDFSGKTVVEGNVALGLPEGAALAGPARRDSKYTPTAGALRGLLGAAYFEVQSEAVVATPPPVPPPPPPPPPPVPPPLGWRWRLAMALQA